MKSSPAKFTLVILLSIVFFPLHAQKGKRSFYEIKVYHFKEARQEKLIDAYLEKALLPGLHRAGIATVGVFKPIANDTAADKIVYVLSPLKSLDQLLSVGDKLKKDNAYLDAGKEFLDIPYDQPAFTRMETIVLQAFELAPAMTTPKLSGPKSERVYELRNYEGASEKLYRNKVKMFNAGGEIPLFERLGFNAVFYGEVIAGSHQPNLMYMTSFDNMQSRTEHWKAFVDSPEWKALVAMPEYKNNVSRLEAILTRATPYSDF